MVRGKLGAFSVIPVRNEGSIPIWKNHGRRYRKQMKRGYSQGALPTISVTRRNYSVCDKEAFWRTHPFSTCHDTE
jgi:hypothetical protein